MLSVNSFLYIMCGHTGEPTFHQRVFGDQSLAARSARDSGRHGPRTDIDYTL
jgi:hypothetical protein